MVVNISLQTPDCALASGRKSLGHMSLTAGDAERVQRLGASSMLITSAIRSTSGLSRSGLV
jgi:hypothetical protein